MEVAKLPSYVKIHSCEDLTRVGSRNDGGYLVSLCDINNSEFLLSLGVNDDWNFERDFTETRSVPLEAYDGSISLAVFIKRAINATIKIYKFKRFIYSMRAVLSYQLFFRGKVKHIKKFVGFDYEDNYVSLDSILSGIEYNNIFLKADIEGSEYRILDEIINHQKKFVGIVIEFHDFDLHQAKIESFISNIDLRVVHAHANNFAPINNRLGMPTVIELTFTSQAVKPTDVELPHKLDRPCNPRRSEIKLTNSI
jgi:hypothetical protein